MIEHGAIERDTHSATAVQLIPTTYAAFYATRPELAAIREDDCEDLADFLADLRAEREGPSA